MSQSEDQLQRYLLGEMSPEERAAYEDEVLSNEDLIDQIYADENARAAIETARRARRERALATGARRSWWRRGMGGWLIPAAAVIAVLAVVLVRQSTTPVSPPLFRGGTSGIVAVKPQGEVSNVPQRFVWHPGKAAAYRFELFDASSHSIFSTVTHDTVVTPTDVTVPTRGYWTVTPLDDLNLTAGEPLLTHYRLRD